MSDPRLAQDYYGALCDIEDGPATEDEWREVARAAAALWAVDGGILVDTAFADWLREVWEGES